MVLNRSKILRARGERGAVAVVVAIVTMFVLLFSAAIVVDLGNARAVRRESQNSADAAALAAANALYPFPASNSCKAGSQASPCFTDAVRAVKDYALWNFRVATNDSGWSSCDAPIAPAIAPSGENCITFDKAVSPTTVSVVIPVKDSPGFFGGFTGKTKIPVSSNASARVHVEFKCSLCFMGSINAGNGDFTVNGGGIAINGSANVGSAQQANWSGAFIGVVAGTNGGKWTPTANQIPSFSDPLASLHLPLDTTGLSSFSDPCSSGPGIYTAKVEIGKCILQPGLYVISNTWSMKNKSELDGTSGVTLYFKGPNGQIDMKNGDLNIVGQKAAGPLQRYAIIYDRDNPNPVSLQGNGTSTIDGILYAPASALDFNGGSTWTINGGPVVAKGVVMANGTKSGITINNPVDPTVTKIRQYLSR
ncbi:pilus assembly protein TadG-related protein [Pedococcus sp. 2YAF34]|uniref:pilus assembly protein TadG-related protein n=1 Tax=Pedococcus sp. 2YAF34 TaxID=3233032 RepID=UPI003F94E1BA